MSPHLDNRSSRNNFTPEITIKVSTEAKIWQNWLEPSKTIHTASQQIPHY